jgi:hypothetical protein
MFVVLKHVTVKSAVKGHNNKFATLFTKISAALKHDIVKNAARAQDSKFVVPVILNRNADKAHHVRNVTCKVEGLFAKS